MRGQNRQPEREILSVDSWGDLVESGPGGVREAFGFQSGNDRPPALRRAGVQPLHGSGRIPGEPCCGEAGLGEREIVGPTQGEPGRPDAAIGRLQAAEEGARSAGGGPVRVDERAGLEGLARDEGCPTPRVVVLVIGFLWRLILNPQWGAVNQFLKSVGLRDWALPWLGEPGLVLIIISLVSC